MSILRDYQRQAIEAINEKLATPDVNRVAVEMATGLGKTITFAAYIDEWLTRDTATPGHVPLRILVLVHTDELVRQAVDKIRFVTKGRWTVGVVKAMSNETDRDIVVASVQTLSRPERREAISSVGLIVVDEAHHAVAKTYVDILEHYGAMPKPCSCALAKPDDPSWGGWGCSCSKATPVIGFTATLSRTDGRGLGHVWQDLAFSRSLPWGIRKGYLVDLVPYTIRIPGVDASASDGQLDAMLSDSIAPEAIVGAWTNHCGKPWSESGFEPSTVLFAPLVRSAEAFADAFNLAGVKAEIIHGGMGDHARRAVLDRYESGVTTVLCNAMILTEGWDSPRTKCVIIGRPTQSVPLFIQMIGRGFRPWLGMGAPPRDQQRCTLLCVAGATNDLVSIADLSDKIGEVKDGTSFLAMEDEWDIGKDIEPDEAMAYAGPVRVEQWDMLVQQSSKAWKYTNGGVPFLPTAKRDSGYVYIVTTSNGQEVWLKTAKRNNRVATAPDLELAMATAEDILQDMGGEIGALLADKTRPWRKGVPSMDMQKMARVLGLDKDLDKILASRASGKAGKLSDLISRVQASRVLDPNADKIKRMRAL